MHLNNPWKKLYENWPARDNREALALKLLSEAKSERIMEETGMNHEECQTAHCRRHEPHIDFGTYASPTAQLHRQPQTLSGDTARCRSLV